MAIITSRKVFNVMSDMNYGLDFSDFQVLSDYKSVHILFFFCIIILWSVRIIRTNFGTVVVGFDVNTHAEEWYVNMLESRALLGKWSHLEEFYIGTYMKSMVKYRLEEMGRNNNHTRWNGLFVIINSEFIRSYFCTVLHYDWPSVILLATRFFVGLLWGGFGVYYY